MKDLIIVFLSTALVVSGLIIGAVAYSRADHHYTFTHGAGCPVGDYDH